MERRSHSGGSGTYLTLPGRSILHCTIARPARRHPPACALEKTVWPHQVRLCHPRRRSSLASCTRRLKTTYQQSHLNAYIVRRVKCQTRHTSGRLGALATEVSGSVQRGDRQPLTCPMIVPFTFRHRHY